MECPLAAIVHLWLCPEPLQGAVAQKLEKLCPAYVVEIHSYDKVYNLFLEILHNGRRNLLTRNEKIDS